MYVLLILFEQKRVWEATERIVQKYIDDFNEKYEIAPPLTKEEKDELLKQGKEPSGAISEGAGGGGETQVRVGGKKGKRILSDTGYVDITLLHEEGVQKVMEGAGLSMSVEYAGNKELGAGEEHN